jgi:hypothetical protein
MPRKSHILVSMLRETGDPIAAGQQIDFEQQYAGPSRFHPSHNMHSAADQEDEAAAAGDGTAVPGGPGGMPPPEGDPMAGDAPPDGQLTDMNTVAPPGGAPPPTPGAPPPVQESRVNERDGGGFGGFGGFGGAHQWGGVAPRAFAPPMGGQQYQQQYQQQPQQYSGQQRQPGWLPPVVPQQQRAPSANTPVAPPASAPTQLEPAGAVEIPHFDPKTFQTTRSTPTNASSPSAAPPANAAVPGFSTELSKINSNDPDTEAGGEPPAATAAPAATPVQNAGKAAHSESLTMKDGFELFLDDLLQLDEAPGDPAPATNSSITPQNYAGFSGPQAPPPSVQAGGAGAIQNWHSQMQQVGQQPSGDASPSPAARRPTAAPPMPSVKPTPPGSTAAPAAPTAPAASAPTAGVGKPPVTLPDGSWKPQQNNGTSIVPPQNLGNPNVKNGPHSPASLGYNPPGTPQPTPATGTAGRAPPAPGTSRVAPANMGSLSPRNGPFTPPGSVQAAPVGKPSVAPAPASVPDARGGTPAQELPVPKGSGFWGGVRPETSGTAPTAAPVAPMNARGGTPAQELPVPKGSGFWGGVRPETSPAPAPGAQTPGGNATPGQLRQGRENVLPRTPVFNSATNTAAQLKDWAMTWRDFEFLAESDKRKR